MFGFSTKEKIAGWAKADTTEAFEQIISTIDSAETPEKAVEYGKQAVDEYFAKQNYVAVSLLSRKLGGYFNTNDMKYTVPISKYAIDRLIKAKKFEEVAFGAVGEVRSYGVDKLLAEGSSKAIIAAVEIVNRLQYSSLRDSSSEVLGKVLDLSVDFTSSSQDITKQDLQAAVKKLTRNILEPSGLLGDIGNHKQRKELRDLLMRVDQSGLSDVKLVPVFDSAVKIAAQSVVATHTIQKAQATIEKGQATFKSSYERIFAEPAATQG